MELDEDVCLCFRVSRRKLMNFVRLNQPAVASQLSQCNGAGTGCGWCVPILKKIFEQSQDLDSLSLEEHSRGRQRYLDNDKSREA